MSFLPLVLIMLVFYFLILRPQQKKEKERKEQIGALQKGDEVLTVGGVFGKVTEVGENHFMLQIDTNVKVRIAKNAVQDVTSKAKS